MMGALLSLVACGDGRPSYFRPEDDLEWLVAEYATPTGQLRAEELGPALQSALPLLSALSVGDRLALVTGAVDEAAEGFRERGADLSSRVNVDGRVDVQVSCSGGGRVDVTLPVVSTRLGPAGEGRADDCRFPASTVPLPPWLDLEQELLGDREVELRGPVGLHLGDAPSLGTDFTLRPTLRLRGSLRVDGLLPIRDVDFRVPDARTLETRLEAPGGGTVVAFSDGASLGVRERRGTWLCMTASGETCTATF